MGNEKVKPSSLDGMRAPISSPILSAVSKSLETMEEAEILLEDSKSLARTEKRLWEKISLDLSRHVRLDQRKELEGNGEVKPFESILRQDRIIGK